MARKVVKKCYYCKKEISEDEKDIIITDKEKYPLLKLNALCHKKCADFTQRELQELDELVEEITSILDIPTIPPRFFCYLQDLRNGTNKMQKINVTRSKKGYRYKIITRTYHEYQKQIKNGIKKNNITESINKLLYSYGVVVNKCSKVRDIMYTEHLHSEKNNQEINIINSDVKFNVENQNNDNSYDWLKEDN